MTVQFDDETAIMTIFSNNPCSNYELFLSVYKYECLVSRYKKLWFIWKGKVEGGSYEPKYDCQILQSHMFRIKKFLCIFIIVSKENCYTFVY